VTTVKWQIIAATYLDNWHYLVAIDDDRQLLIWNESQADRDSFAALHNIPPIQPSAWDWCPEVSPAQALPCERHCDLLSLVDNLLDDPWNGHKTDEHNDNDNHPTNHTTKEARDHPAHFTLTSM
jgi:hypothetical protein